MPSRFWYLLARKLADEATLDEIRELEKALFENSDNASMAEIYSDFFKKKQKRKISSEELKEAWKFQLERMTDDFQRDAEPENKNTKIKILKKRWSILAAASFVFAVIAIGWMLAGNNRREDKKTSVSNSEIITAAADREVKKILPDGSQVWLNKGSRLLYNQEFGVTNREITLIGEAFFDVVHKAELPMVVHARAVDIRVKGTAFNVKAYSDDEQIEAALIRGSIEVLNTKDKKVRLLMKPNEKLVVNVNTGDAKAKTQAKAKMPENYQLDTLMIEESSGLIPEISWIQGKLVFNNENFSQLAGKLERWYNVQIVLEDIELAKEKFTGVFDGESLQEALSALQFTYDFKYSIDGNKVILTKK